MGQRERGRGRKGGGEGRDGGRKRNRQVGKDEYSPKECALFVPRLSAHLLHPDKGLIAALRTHGEDHNAADLSVGRAERRDWGREGEEKYLKVEGWNKGRAENERRGNGAAYLELFNEGARDGSSRRTHVDSVVRPLVFVALPACLAFQGDHS